MRPRHRGNVVAHRAGWTFALLMWCTSAATAQRAAPAKPACTGDGSWARLIVAHVARYPAMQLPDLYKLLHQSTMGSEHAIRDEQMVHDWMRRELADLGTGPAESLADTLGRGGRFVRVHLRPFVEHGGVIDSLLQAFVATGTTAAPDTQSLRCAIAAARDLARRHRIPFTADATNRYFEARAAAGFAAVEHTSVFVRTYRPAYRVVALPLLERAFGGMARRGDF